MEALKVYQIYFKEEQKQLLDYQPYYNQDCTVFFENSIIAKLIEDGKHIGHEYFGVVSYKLREKIGSVMKERWKSLQNIANHSNQEFTPEFFEELLLKHKPDVMSFQRHLPHDPISLADKFHPNFSGYFRKIMGEIGYDWKPQAFKDILYCNYFVAKSHWYEAYVKEMLIPAMEVMESMPELMGNSGYPHKLPEDLKMKFGIDHYPYHPFLCERMMSYYVWLNKLECLHY